MEPYTVYDNYKINVMVIHDILQQQALNLTLILYIFIFYSK